MIETRLCQKYTSVYQFTRLESLQTAQSISFFPEILRGEFSFLRGRREILRVKF
jgi:hypothetical protein